MHEYGQPLHAFDADKIEGNEIYIRTAKKKETMEALDNQTYELTDKMLVIADAKKTNCSCRCYWGNAYRNYRANDKYYF